MGAVYRATDTKLNRDVAIKVLPEAFARDTARMQRFEREAQLLASLNHPNIAAIYGAEQGALVMELVEGANLHGPVTVETAIGYAKQIAAGLEAAHEKGIVHRDLKPANIRVTPEGGIKILDFGLAKATEPSTSASGADPSISPTVSLTMTQTGVILGTAAYMAPEQARGKTVDKRADIWAFGVTFYELLTGANPFSARETPDIIASVIAREPDFGLLPKDTPSHIVRLLGRCLQKDPKKRLRDIGDARFAFEDPPEAAPAAASRRSWLTWAACATAIVSLAAAGAAWMRILRTAPNLGVERFQIRFPPGAVLPRTNNNVGFPMVAPSPDGRNLAMIVLVEGRTKLSFRPLAADAAHYVERTEDANQPFWSPDGQSIAFFTGNRILRAEINSGAVSTVCEWPTGKSHWGGTWGKNGTIVFSLIGGPLMVVPAGGGVQSALTTLSKDEESHLWPQMLPDGRHVLYLSKAAAGPDGDAIYVQDLNTGNRVRVMHSLTRAIWASPGYLLFVRDNNLLAQPIDLRTFQLQGASAVVAQAVGEVAEGSASSFAASENGVLMYQVRSTEERQISWHDRTGKAVGSVGKPEFFREMTLSPDERTLAAIAGANGKFDVWTIDVASGITTALTRDGNLEATNPPVWSPDSKIVAVSPRGGGIELITVASGKTELVTKESLNVQSWSPDASSILCNDIFNRRFVLVPLSSPERPKTIFAAKDYAVWSLRFSPDGKYVAFVSNEGGPTGGSIFVTSFPSLAEKRRVSVGRGSHPVWTRDGKLFYRASDDLVEVEIRTGSGIIIGEHRTLFQQRANGIPRFAVTAGGQRFFFLDRVRQNEPDDNGLNLVINWPELFKKP
jgi:Tol biopolymer transport system component